MWKWVNFARIKQRMCYCPVNGCSWVNFNTEYFEMIWRGKIEQDIYPFIFIHKLILCKKIIPENESKIMLFVKAKKEEIDLRIYLYS